MIELIVERFATLVHQPCIIVGDAVTTYGELSLLIEEASAFLDTVRVSPGDSIALLGDYSGPAIAMLIALVRRSAIVVPLNAKSQVSYRYQLDVACVSRLVDVTSGIPRVVELAPKGEQIVEFTELRRRGSPGLVLFSSGTSGKPKGVINDFGLLLNKFRKPARPIRALGFLLFDHIGGINTLFSVLSSGGTLVAIDERSPSAVCRAIERHRVEVLPTSPSFLNLMLAAQVANLWNLQSLRMITYGTEPMSEATLKRLHGQFPSVKLKQTYGLSELGILATKSRSPDSLWMKIGGFGDEVRVREGMLEVKAASAMLGYIGAPSPFTVDGWFRTGDEVEVDGEYFRVLGRRSEMINVGGQKIHPTEVEGVLEGLTGVTEVRVFAEPNALTGHIVRADVVLTTNETGRQFKARMHQECGHLLDAYKLPQKIVVVCGVLHSDRFKKERRISTR